MWVYVRHTLCCDSLLVILAPMYPKSETEPWRNALPDSCKVVKEKFKKMKKAKCLNYCFLISWFHMFVVKGAIYKIMSPLHVVLMHCMYTKTIIYRLSLKSNLQYSTCEFQSTVYRGWCPDWCWPSGGLAGHSRSSRHFLGWPGPSAERSLLLETSP